ncbi:MAG: phasin family protein [Gammaproteobacteria bacterium]|nr:phasin family protein [Gammaproteobacteria bacterium]
MVSKARKLLDEQKAFMGEQARVLRQAPGTLVRRAAAKSAERVRALSKPAQVVTRSGLRLTSISQHAAEGLLEVQLDVVTAALSNAAEQLDRIARARSLRSLVGGQAEELKAARERIAADIKRVVDILKRAGKGARSVATEALDEVRRPAARQAMPARRKRAKSAARRPRRAARKTRG